MTHSSFDRLAAGADAPHRTEHLLPPEMRRVVESLYGPPVRRLPGLDVGRAYWGATKEFRYGGDIVDVFHYGHGCTSFTVVDISGHGIRAARYAGLAKYALRAYASLGFNALDSIRALNRLYIENSTFEGEHEFFATAFFAIMDARRETMHPREEFGANRRRVPSGLRRAHVIGSPRP